MSVKLTVEDLRRQILSHIGESVLLAEEEATTTTPATPATSQGEEAEDATAGLDANVEQMSPKKAQEMAAMVFGKINQGQIANARSTMNSLMKTAAGRIALAVQALRWYGNASAAEINTNAGIIRKIAASVDAPPDS